MLIHLTALKSFWVISMIFEEKPETFLDKFLKKNLEKFVKKTE